MVQQGPATPSMAAVPAEAAGLPQNQHLGRVLALWPLARDLGYRLKLNTVVGWGADLWWQLGWWGLVWWELGPQYDLCHCVLAWVFGCCCCDAVGGGALE